MVGHTPWGGHGWHFQLPPATVCVFFVICVQLLASHRCFLIFPIHTLVLSLVPAGILTMKMRSIRGTAATRADTATMNTVLMRFVTCPLLQICLFYMMLTSRWVGSVMFAFEEVVHWLQTAAGDHLHLRLPKLQRLELERNGDHRCPGHRRQWGSLLQGAVHLLLRQDKTNWVDLHKFPIYLCYKGYHWQLRSHLLQEERDHVRLLRS